MNSQKLEGGDLEYFFKDNKINKAKASYVEMNDELEPEMNSISRTLVDSNSDY